jgi:hypothetical protein
VILQCQECESAVDVTTKCADDRSDEVQEV